MCLAKCFHVPLSKEFLYFVVCFTPYIIRKPCPELMKELLDPTDLLAHLYITIHGRPMFDSGHNPPIFDRFKSFIVFITAWRNNCVCSNLPTFMSNRLEMFKNYYL